MMRWEGVFGKQNLLIVCPLNLDTAQFIALQNLARSVSFGHKRHSTYATTFMMPSSRGARLDAYARSARALVNTARLKTNGGPCHGGPWGTDTEREEMTER